MRLALFEPKAKAVVSYETDGRLAAEELLPPGLAGRRAGVVGRRRCRRLDNYERLAGLYEAEHPPGHELDVGIAAQIVADLLELGFLNVKGIDLSPELVLVLSEPV